MTNAKNETKQSKTTAPAAASSNRELVITRIIDAPREKVQEYPNRGVYLEVVKNERLVFTDVYTKAWEPSEKPFVTVTREDLGGKTRYTAHSAHLTVADRETHEKMGFRGGWALCADQLAALVTKS